MIVFLVQYNDTCRILSSFYELRKEAPPEVYRFGAGDLWELYDRRTQRRLEVTGGRLMVELRLIAEQTLEVKTLLCFSGENEI
ncbi:hypothetical protein D5086_032069 [Populus alba]|uniref:Uncharacterized protein n=1 Tax=Populus alba TaxID=43335 RepID=A0ACC4AKB9_POPAL